MRQLHRTGCPPEARVVGVNVEMVFLEPRLIGLVIVTCMKWQETHGLVYSRSVVGNSHIPSSVLVLLSNPNLPIFSGIFLSYYQRFLGVKSRCNRPSLVIVL